MIRSPLSMAICVVLALASQAQADVTVTYPADDPQLELRLSDVGGSLASARLLNPRFTRDARPPMDGVPAYQIDAGPIDLVSTWSPVYYPYRLLFNHLSAPGQAEILIGAATGARIEGTVLTPGALAQGGTTPLPGDVIRISAPAALVGDFTVGGVTGSGAVTLSSAPALSGARDSAVSYTIHRRGDVASLYSHGARFTRMDSGDTLPVTYVWPNPATDTSPIFIERRYEAGRHPHELALTVVIHNVSPGEVKAQIGVEISGWQHPGLTEAAMFMEPPDLYAASCFTGEAYEREDYPSLYEEPRSFSTATEWVGIENRYMLLAITSENLTGAQCSLRADPPPLGVVSATIWAGSTHVIRGRDGGCVPSWLSGLEGAVSCADSAARLGHDDKASVKTLRSAWQTKREDADPVTQAELDGAWKSIKNRRRSLYRFSLYAGPKDADFLKTSGHRLDASLDFGMLEFIGKPMLIAMRWFQSLTGDWALAIIMLTLIVKSVLLPLTNKSFKQMQRMSQLRPQLDELKEKHGDDREKFAKAQMALFKREGVNPLGGCLPMVIQMPIWFALYRTIYSSVELYHAPLGFWIQDLSAPDPLYIFPVILGFLMLAQSYFQPMAAGMDPVQAKMMKYGMPLMFSVFMIALPSGLVLYIMVNTLLTIFQNIHIRRSMA
jgi:YidC/Oxa1 family membrane protein insertase